MDRLQRLIHLLRSRSQSFDELIDAGSLAEVLDWGRSHHLVGFNASAVRLRIVCELSREFRATHFVETGTYHGATAIAARRCLNLRVVTCERDWKRALVAKSVTLGMTGVGVIKEDSRTFLGLAVEKLSLVGARPFFYLDAHGGKGGQEIPLLDEIAAVLQFAEFVVMIDDFAVPGAAFKYDTWESIPLTIDLIGDIFRSAGVDRVYVPSYAASIEEPSTAVGYAVIVRSADVQAAIKESGFPLQLLREVPIT